MTRAGGEVAFSVHCHNDLGLAVANSLAAIRSGARQVECTVNGIGERAGNTSLEEVVMALRTRAKFFPGLRHEHRRREEIYARPRWSPRTPLGIAVQANKAIVGDNAFAHEAGIHQDGVLKACDHLRDHDARVDRPRQQRARAREAFWSSMLFRDRLAELGFAVEGEDFERAFKRFKDLADAKKVIYNEDLEAIVADSACTAGDRYLFESLVLTCGSDGLSAKVALDLEGDRVEMEVSGVGPVDAIFKAISDLTATGSELIHTCPRGDGGTRCAGRGLGHDRRGRTPRDHERRPRGRDGGECEGLRARAQQARVAQGKHAPDEPKGI